MSNNPGLISKFIDLEAGLRISIVDSTQAVQEMQKIQSTLPLASIFVGRAMTAAALMASHLKEKEMVSLYFRGDGPIQMVFAESNYEGHVRGYTANPTLDLELVAGQYPLGAAIGIGNLTVVRTHAIRGAPYRGTVELQTGEVGDDVAFYLMQSHQVRSVVAVGVKLSSYGIVSAAGGIILELLPGANDSIVDQIEAQVAKVGSISESFESGRSHFDIAMEYSGPLKKLQKLDFEHKLTYTCRCSQDRLVRSIELLPVADLDDLLTKETVDAKCEFCGRQYQMTRGEVQAIRDKTHKNSLN